MGRKKDDAPPKPPAVDTAGGFASPLRSGISPVASHTRSARKKKQPTGVATPAKETSLTKVTEEATEARNIPSQEPKTTPENSQGMTQKDTETPKRKSTKGVSPVARHTRSGVKKSHIKAPKTSATKVETSSKHDEHKQMEAESNEDFGARIPKSPMREAPQLNEISKETSTSTIKKKTKQSLRLHDEKEDSIEKISEPPTNLATPSKDTAAETSTSSKKKKRRKTVGSQENTPLKEDSKEDLNTKGTKSPTGAARSHDTTTERSTSKSETKLQKSAKKGNRTPVDGFDAKLMESPAQSVLQITAEPSTSTKKAKIQQAVKKYDEDVPMEDSKEDFNSKLAKSPSRTESQLMSTAAEPLTSTKKEKRKKVARTQAELTDVSIKVQDSSKKVDQRQVMNSEAIVDEVGVGHDHSQKLPSESTVSIDKEKSNLPGKSPPTIDVTVHRVRHLNYRPKPISCFAPTPFDAEASDYVAVSRENGHVELRSPDEKWRNVATVAGLSSRSVDVMAWTCGCCPSTEEVNDVEMPTTFSSTFHKSHTRVHCRRTLVGASRDGTIFVVDFAHGRQTAVTGSGGGGVFSLVSLCGSSACHPCCSQLVAAGCEDGSVRIYRITHDKKTKLELVSTVPCAGAAILSLAWKRLSKDGSQRGVDGTVLYAGVSDGTIRRFECVSALTNARLTGTSAHAISTGTVVLNDRDDAMSQNWKSTLRMTVETYGRTTPTRIWALKALSDGTVISADSLGHVQFWDGQTGTLLQSFDQNDSKADVLALAVSDNECRVFASGVDSRVVCIERPAFIPGPNTSSAPQRWLLTHAQRPHTHDVKALAICRLQDKSGTLQGRDTPEETLCSGGLDIKICSYLVNDFSRGRPKNWYPWPSISPIAVAADARLLAMTRENRVDFHRLAAAQNSPKSLPMLVPEDVTLVGKLAIKGNQNLTCSAISIDGKRFALSDASTLMLFQLQQTEDNSIVPCKLVLATPLRVPCLALTFASKDRLVCATSDGRINLLTIHEDANTKQVKVELEHSEHVSDSYAIHALHVSHDGAWLAAVRGGVGCGAVQLYSISEGAPKHWWSLPALEAPFCSMKFLRGDIPQFVVACSNFAFYLFDIKERRMSSWSEKNGFPVSPCLPDELKHRTDYPVWFAVNPATPGNFLLGTHGAFSAVSTEKPLPKQCDIFPEKHVRGKKRKWNAPNTGKDAEETASNSNCTICLRYNSMLCLDFIAENEMLVVEEPWLNIVATFPDALERRVFGS